MLNHLVVGTAEALSYEARFADGVLTVAWSNGGPAPAGTWDERALFEDCHADWRNRLTSVLERDASYTWGHSIRYPGGRLSAVCHIVTRTGKDVASGLIIPFESLDATKLDFLEHLPVGVYLLDHQYRIQWTNELGTRQSHINWKENYGQVCYAHPFGLGTPCEDCPVSKTFEDGNHHVTIKDMPNNNTWLISSAPARDADGKPYGAIEVVVDITAIARERDRSIELLRQKQQQLDNLLANLPGAAFRMRYGAEGADFDYMSEGGHVLTGVGFEAMKADRRMLCKLIDEEDYEPFHKAHSEGIAVGDTVEIMFRLKVEGAVKWVLEKSRVIAHDREKREFTFEGFTHDVTDRIKLREAELASEAKSNFLAAMSHEIRTPLNAITGFVHLLGKSELSPAQNDYLAKIDTASSAMLEIINSILDFSKIEAGKMDVINEPFDLGSMLEAMRALFSQIAVQRNLDFTVSVADNVPRELVGDSMHIRQILVNLINNAFKFTDSGGVSLACALDGPDPADRTPGAGLVLRFTVSDTGIGITDEALQRVFSPFEQADGSVSRRHGGTGLGLSIVRSLVELLQGVLDVRSEPGAGSVFSFTCRVCRQPDDLRRGEREERHIPLFRSQEVLLVEDNEVNREIAVTLLEAVSLRVTVAENGAEAVRLASASAPGRFALILMDIQMPVMDGFQATREIRALPGMGGIPIVAMTAHALDSEITRCLDAGMQAHISKPLDVHNFYAVLGNYLEEDRS